ncbi:MAG: alpha/beta fold hydrolase [Leptolyngbya sp.]|nr:alpha/beta fold hydrolase [Leptolyngbya sp.]
MPPRPRNSPPYGGWPLPHRLRGWRRWRSGLLSLATAGLWLAAMPGRAAERLIISYGPLERTVSMADIETFASTGQLSAQLQAYNRRFHLSKAQLNQAQQALTTPAEMLHPVGIAQFLYTQQGERLLQELTRVVRTPARVGDFSALRAAIILGAVRAEDGVTLLDVLRAYPLEAIRIDLAEGFVVAGEINRAIFQSAQAVNLVQHLSHQEAEAAPLTPAEVADLLGLLQATRIYTVGQTSRSLPGLAQPVNLYLPQLQPQQPSPPQGFPLIIISHGLGGNRHSYGYLANSLASAGFAVVALDHTGSNDEQLIALLEGRTAAVVPNGEFLRRPQEISLTLDALQAIQTSLPVPLDLSRIGIVGQSFGGYTALALAGATFDRQTLNAACPPKVLTFNPSLLLQCQATTLVDPQQTLQDSRVDAIFVMNPVGSVLFGPTGYQRIAIPTMVVSSAADTVAPAFPEQILPFTWLSSPERYLVLIGRGTHFSVIGDTGAEDQPLAIPPEIIGPRPDLAQGYMQILALAHFQLTLNQDERFRPMVQADFLKQISGETYPLYLSTTLSPAGLESVLEP